MRAFNNMSDLELVELCIRNDRAAWEEFFRRYISVIKHAIRGKLREQGFANSGDDQDAVWDIHEKIVIKLYSRGLLGHCINPSGVRQWLKTVSQNQTLDWIAEQRRKKRLPEKHAENTMVSLFEPLKNNDGLTLADTIADDSEPTEDCSEYVETALNQIDEIKDEKKKWILRLSIILQLPLSDDEMEELATVSGLSLSEIKERNEIIFHQLEEKENKRVESFGKAILLWHEIRRLETQLLEKQRHEDVQNEIDELKQLIDEKAKKRETFLQESKRIVRPSNHDISGIIGLPEDKIDHVSTILTRARAMLAKEMEKILSK